MCLSIHYCFMDSLNKIKVLVIGLILLAYLILPTMADLVANGNWSAIGISTGLVTGLMIIIVVFYIFGLMGKDGKRS